MLGPKASKRTLPEGLVPNDLPMTSALSSRYLPPFGSVPASLRGIARDIILGYGLVFKSNEILDGYQVL